VVGGGVDDAAWCSGWTPSENHYVKNSVVYPIHHKTDASKISCASQTDYYAKIKILCLLGEINVTTCMYNETISYQTEFLTPELL